MKYDKLYLDILKIGSSKLDSGLSYNDLKSELEKKGYDFENDCIELAVKQWFYDCFHHYADKDEIKSVYDIDKHLDCNWILKGSSCLAMVEHKTSKYNLDIARIALLVAFIALIMQCADHRQQSQEQSQQNKVLHPQQHILIPANPEDIRQEKQVQKNK